MCLVRPCFIISIFTVNYFILIKRGFVNPF
nr:MAG TPA: hypothetical protein [Caudoviricetes sp.]